MNILILEDEAVAARRVERLTRAVLGDGAKTAVTHALDEARTAMADQSFDVILLDLNLSGDDGFDLITEGSGGAAVIVVSAFPDRAIEAFGHAVLDFVPKPVTEDRLRQAFDRVAQSRGAHAPRRLIVRNPGRADFVDLDTIVRIAGADDYSEIVLASGRSLLHDETLSALEQTLPESFLRVHRSYIANLDHASGLAQQGSSYVLQQTGGLETPVGRRRVSQVREIIARQISS